MQLYQFVTSILLCKGNFDCRAVLRHAIDSTETSCCTESAGCQGLRITHSDKAFTKSELFPSQENPLSQESVTVVH